MEKDRTQFMYDNVFKNKIDSSSVLYSKGKNDECYTPNYAVLPYNGSGTTILCDCLPQGYLVVEVDKKEYRFLCKTLKITPSNN